MLGEDTIKKVLNNILQVDKAEIKYIRKIFRCLDEALEAKEKLEYEEDEKERKNCSRIYEEYVPITVAAYEDILKMLALVSSKKWYRSVNIEIPIMLIGGQEDPIGNFGKGIEEVHRYLEDSCHRVEMRLYKGMRHNICDEVRKEAVYIDILQWMKLHLNEQYEI